MNPLETYKQEHQKIEGKDLHVPYRWIVEDASHLNTLDDIKAEDLYKIAYIKNTGDLYTLNIENDEYTFKRSRGEKGEKGEVGFLFNWIVPNQADFKNIIPDPTKDRNKAAFINADDPCDRQVHIYLGVDALGNHQWMDITSKGEPGKDGINGLLYAWEFDTEQEMLDEVVDISSVGKVALVVNAHDNRKRTFQLKSVDMVTGRGSWLDVTHEGEKGDPGPRGFAGLMFGWEVDNLIKLNAIRPDINDDIGRVAFVNHPDPNKRRYLSFQGYYTNGDPIWEDRSIPGPIGATGKTGDHGLLFEWEVTDVSLLPLNVNASQIGKVALVNDPDPTKITYHKLDSIDPNGIPTWKDVTVRGLKGDTGSHGLLFNWITQDFSDFSNKAIFPRPKDPEDIHKVALYKDVDPSKHKYMMFNGLDANGDELWEDVTVKGDRGDKGDRGEHGLLFKWHVSDVSDLYNLATLSPAILMPEDKGKAAFVEHPSDPSQNKWFALDDVTNGIPSWVDVSIKGDQGVQGPQGTHGLLFKWRVSNTIQLSNPTLNVDPNKDINYAALVSDGVDPSNNRYFIFKGVNATTGVRSWEDVTPVGKKGDRGEHGLLFKWVVQSWNDLATLNINPIPLPTDKGRVALEDNLDPTLRRYYMFDGYNANGDPLWNDVTTYGQKGDQGEHGLIFNWEVDDFSKLNLSSLTPAPDNNTDIGKVAYVNTPNKEDRRYYAYKGLDASNNRVWDDVTVYGAKGDTGSVGPTGQLFEWVVDDLTQRPTSAPVSLQNRTCLVKDDGTGKKRVYVAEYIDPATNLISWLDYTHEGDQGIPGPQGNHGLLFKWIIKNQAALTTLTPTANDVNLVCLLDAASPQDRKYYLLEGFDASGLPIWKDVTAKGDKGDKGDRGLLFEWEVNSITQLNTLTPGTSDVGKCAFVDTVLSKDRKFFKLVGIDPITTLGVWKDITPQGPQGEHGFLFEWTVTQASDLGTLTPDVNTDVGKCAFVDDPNPQNRMYYLYEGKNNNVDVWKDITPRGQRGDKGEIFKWIVDDISQRNLITSTNTSDLFHSCLVKDDGNGKKRVYVAEVIDTNTGAITWLDYTNEGDQGPIGPQGPAGGLFAWQVTDENDLDLPSLTPDPNNNLYRLAFVNSPTGKKYLKYDGLDASNNRIWTDVSLYGPQGPQGTKGEIFEWIVDDITQRDALTTTDPSKLYRSCLVKDDGHGKKRVYVAEAIDTTTGTITWLDYTNEGASGRFYEWVVNTDTDLNNLTPDPVNDVNKYALVKDFDNMGARLVRWDGTNFLDDFSRSRGYNFKMTPTTDGQLDYMISQAYSLDLSVTGNINVNIINNNTTDEISTLCLYIKTDQGVITWDPSITWVGGNTPALKVAYTIVNFMLIDGKAIGYVYHSED